MPSSFTNSHLITQHTKSQDITPEIIMTATFTIEPVSESDIPELTAGAQKAFLDFNKLMFSPYPVSAESQAQMIEKRTKGLHRDPRARNFKAVDRETGAIIATARWCVYAEDQVVEESLEDQVEERLNPRIPELRVDFMRRFWTAMFSGKREILAVDSARDLHHSGPDREKDENQEQNGGIGGNKVVLKKRVELESLFTHPDYQRRGAGRALVEMFLQDADQVGLMAYLEATADGKPLYERCGMETLRTDTIGTGLMDEDGLEIRRQFTYMTRLPKTDSVGVEN